MTRQLFALWALLALGACASPLTGLYCAEGYTQCGSACVDLDEDLANCGGCGMACPAEGWVCLGGQCGMELPGGGIDFDASIPDGSVDGSVDGGDGGDGGSQPPRPIPDPTKPLCDGMLAASECRCDVGSLKCGNVCVDPDSDPEHCGQCNAPCADGQFCADGLCVDDCEAPFEQCSGRCFDTESSIFHCGGCGKSCSTRLCTDGVCAGGLTGHLVFVGHDYVQTNAEQLKIIPGAVSLNNRFAPRILGYSEGTEARALENINLALLDSLGILPEDIEEVFLPALSFQLSEADVLLIYPQRNLTQSELVSKVRPAFEGVLPSFLAAGGVVVVFESPSFQNQGTYQIVAVDDLTDVTGRERLDTGDSVTKTPEGFRGFTNGAATPYRAERNTCGFEGVAPGDSGVLLYSEDTGLPVVIQTIYGG